MKSLLSGQPYCRLHQKRAAYGPNRAREHDQSDYLGLLHQREDLRRGVTRLFQRGAAHAQQNGAAKKAHQRACAYCRRRNEHPRNHKSEANGQPNTAARFVEQPAKWITRPRSPHHRQRVGEPDQLYPAAK